MSSDLWGCLLHNVQTEGTRGTSPPNGCTYTTLVSIDDPPLEIWQQFLGREG